jgi:diguanylate cyclase (GGDEF)-like protein
MSRPGAVCWLLLSFLLAGTASAAVNQAAPLPRDPAQLLNRADGDESSNIAEFNAILRKLSDPTIKLSPEQQLYRSYLKAREVIFHGDFKAAIPMMEAIAGQSANPVLAFRANATVVDLLVTQSRYEDAFERLDPLLVQLPKITEQRARIQALGVASQLYLEAGQYDLAANYAEQLLHESGSAKSTCIAWYYRMDALVRGGHVETSGAQLHDGMDACGRAGDVLIADMFESVVARFDIQRGRHAEAIALLSSNYTQVQSKLYPPVIADFDELLALAYWKTGDVVRAKDFALRVISNNKGIGGVYSESTATAYRILYEIEKSGGDLGAALAYHEKYMVADKGYLDDVSAKVLAYQIVKQKVLAKKLQIDELDKKNKILTLQEELDHKAAETSRLYIALLLLVLASIGLWTYRVKRSQLRFMKLARRDGLTGIFNRQHFVDETEQQLQYCKKSAREACILLIDLDHFKAVNDTHGHEVGDRVLQRAVEVCQKHLRSTDIFGRLGGEEFGILLPDCTLEKAYRRAEKIRMAIATAATGENPLGILISASFGIAVTTRSGYELRKLLIHADEALYRAKREGRNRVVASEELEESLSMG